MPFFGLFFWEDSPEVNHYLQGQTSSNMKRFIEIHLELFESSCSQRLSKRRES